MDWRESFKDRLLSFEEAALKVPTGAAVLTSMGVGIPYKLLDAVSKSAEGITLYLAMVASPVKAYLPPFNKNIQVVSWFIGPIERASMRMKPRLSYQPMHLSNIDMDRIKLHRPDVVLLQVAPQLADGMLSQGPSPLAADVIGEDTVVIAQINEAVPYIYGEGNMIPADRVNWFTEGASPLYELKSDEPGDVERAIAGYIVDRVPDGACIQLGIGGIGSAVGSFLRDKKELGIHTEMFVESMVDLIECGAVTNSRKQLMPGKTVFGFASGTKRMYDFLGGSADVESRPFNWVNDPRVISQNDNVVSINSALQIDLTGQVCAESIGRNQFSGTGGQVDYVRGAHWSKGGQSFIAMPSSRTDKAGNRYSKISLSLPEGSAVTTLRADVQYVVTEFGLAELENQPVDVRAKRLIAIAHPEFREELERQAREAGYIL